MKLLSAFLVISLVFNQSVAIAQTTRATAEVLGAQVNANDPVRVISAANQLENTISEHVGELTKEDQAVTAGMTPREQARFDRKRERWSKRLARLSTKAKKDFNAHIDNLDDEALHTKVTEMTANAEASGQPELATRIEGSFSSPSQAKANLKEAFATNAEAMIPTIASNIATSGGILPYMLHLKSQIHEESQKLQTAMLKKNKLDRQIASASTASLIVLAALLVLLIFGSIFAISAVIYAASTGLMIDSVIICVETGNSCFLSIAISGR